MNILFSKAAVFFLCVLLFCGELSAQDSSKPPPLKEAVWYADLIVVAKVTRVDEPQKEGEETVQCLEVSVEEVLKGEFKKGERLLAEFYAPRGSRWGYNLPLVERFAKVDNRVVLLLKIVTQKVKEGDKDVEKRFYVSVSPLPDKGELDGTEENIKKIKEVVEEFKRAKAEEEKIQKEYEKQRDEFKKKKFVTVEKPPMRVDTPSKEWYFAALEAEKKWRLAGAASDETKKQIESEYENRLIELRNDDFGARATFYAMETKEEWKMDEIKASLEKNIKEGYKDSRITSRREVKLYNNALAWRFVFEAKVGEEERVYERYTLYAKNALFDVIMSVPKKDYEKVEKDFSKIIRNFKF
ncbi:MAG: hypothetical protein N2234_03045 [Planctomycetota bacterium]|nr:hypothetical protein [Planctomycetota bacterium]